MPISPRRPVPRPTVRDVAARAGVGVGTVSRYLNGSPALGEAARAAVARAVAALDYRPHPSGRALRSGSTGTVGVLVPTVSNPIFGLSLDGIESRLREAGRATVVATSGYDPDEQRAALETLCDREVDGLIVTLCDPVAEQREPMTSRALPHVLIYNEPRGDGPDAPLTVTVDNFAAAREATRRLIEAGHRHIAFLGGRFRASDRSRARHAGYRHAMEASGLPPWRAVEIPFEPDADMFERAVAGLLDRLRRPTALVCSNDLLALHAIDAARRLGLAVPGELAVIGFDGMPMAELVSPSLTTIRQPAREMGRVAAELLLARLDGGENAPPGESVVLPHAFVAGETFGGADGRRHRGRTAVRTDGDDRGPDERHAPIGP